MVLNRRSELHEQLCKILGTRHCYFSPPASIQLHYPCIVYNLNDAYRISADNINYIQSLEYVLTLIDRNPDSEFLLPILGLPKCSLDRTYVSDELNHFVFSIYY